MTRPERLLEQRFFFLLLLLLLVLFLVLVLLLFSFLVVFLLLVLFLFLVHFHQVRDHPAESASDPLQNSAPTPRCADTAASSSRALTGDLGAMLELVALSRGCSLVRP